MKLQFFPFLLIFYIFTAVSSISGQDSYNIYTLEYFKQSLECLFTGDYDNAILHSSNVIRRDPNSSVAYTVRARAYFEKNDTNNAIADCTKAIGLDRNNISAYSIRGSAYARRGELNRAITDWEAVLRINPENAEVKHNLELARQQRTSR